MSIGFSSGSTPSYRRVMYFIDGGYLRRQLMDITGTDDFTIKNLPYKLNKKFFGGRIQGEIIRVYYYDAICEHTEPRYKEQRILFDKINGTEFYEVKLANLIKKGDGRYEQKGVDVLISVDMMSKAYENHYDVAIVIMGDRDFLPLIKSIKDYTGKRIFGVVFEKSYAEELSREFDKKLVLNEIEIKKIFKQN